MTIKNQSDKELAAAQPLDLLADTKMTTSTYVSVTNTLHYCRDALTGRGYFGAQLAAKGHGEFAMSRAYSEGRPYTFLATKWAYRAWQAARAASPASQPVAPSGWKPMPIQPTKEMMDAARLAWCITPGNAIEESYAAMWRAAPAAVAPSDAPGKVVDLAGAEFLSKRLARVARAAGVSMPDGSHEFIAGVAGTILGDIARKLESANGKADAAKCRGCDPAEGFCKYCRSVERRKADAANAGDLPARWQDRSWAHANPDELDPEDHTNQLLAEIADWRAWGTKIIATSAADAKDASRYRWLRKQHWSNSLFCVVRNPKKSVKFGMDCPNFELLDNAIDAAMAAAPSSAAGKEGGE